MFIVIWYRKVSNFKELVSAINKKTKADRCCLN